MKAQIRRRFLDLGDDDDEIVLDDEEVIESHAQHNSARRDQESDSKEPKGESEPEPNLLGEDKDEDDDSSVVGATEFQADELDGCSSSIARLDCPDRDHALLFGETGGDREPRAGLRLMT